jgi:poly-beta-1,6-N-acetyl-D-glucosamine synthase
MTELLSKWWFLLPALFLILYWRNAHLLLRAMQSTFSSPPMQGHAPKKSLAVLIPYCNEMPHLVYLLDDLLQLELDGLPVSIYLINDHSTDGGEIYVKEHLPQSGCFFHLDSTALPGKKQALQFALDHTSSDIIATTDADVRLPKQWVKQMLSIFEASEPYLLIGQVRMENGTGFLQRFQFTEWLLLQGLTVGSGSQQKAVLCNGANLMMERATLLQTGAYQWHLHEQSGDDMYSMLAFKQFGEGAVRIMPSADASPSIQPINSWKKFIHQRLRWSGKKKMGLDPDVRKQGLIVGSANLSLLFCALASPWLPYSTHLFFALLGIKCIADFSIADNVAKNRSQNFFELDLIVFNMIYPFYMTLIFLLSRFYTPRWKHQKG